MLEDKPAWILLDCQPIEGKSVEPVQVWWSPDKGELYGADAPGVEALIERVVSQQKDYPFLAQRILDNPLGDLEQLAAILSLFYWVIPEPVLGPGETNAQLASSQVQ